MKTETVTAEELNRSAPETRRQATELAWEEFLYAYVETGWFDYEDRPKTMKAMRRVWERIPADTLQDLPSVTVFAPSPCKRGEVLPFGGRFEQNAAFVYLSPTLESEPQVQVDFTVAHEFAHVVLGHHFHSHPDICLSADQSAKITHNFEVPAEIKADALTESWGFKVPDERTRLRAKTRK